MLQFIGEYESTLDAKGRFLLPVAFKKQAATSSQPQTFVLNRGFEQCLTLYPLESWQPLYKQISALNDFDPQVRTFRRYFLNGAIQVELDSAGRLLIPKNLLEYAGIQKNVVLASAIDKIEIWDKNNYQKFFDGISATDFSNIANTVMNHAAKTSSPEN